MILSSVFKMSRMNLLMPTKQKENQLVKNKCGFTLVETMVAGAVMSLILIAVSRFSISSIATSQQQSERRKLEAAINNDIQLLQQADSRLKLVDISDKQTACADPGLFLKQALTDETSDFYVKEPILKDREGKLVLQRQIDHSKSPTLAVVTYTFLAPEQSITSEERVVRMYPNFHYLCGVL